jgi:hypothetical protein
MQSTHAMPGAHAFVQRYAPANSKSTQKPNPKSKYLPSSVSFGARVDAYLTSFVDQGWLDLGYACDPQFEHLLRQGDKAATAAHSIRDALIKHGFVATESQLPAPAFGLCPVLDLVGYNIVGDRVIVEIKCGRSSMDSSTSTGQMAAPFASVANNGHARAMMQLAVQRTCFAHAQGTHPHAWLLTHAYIAQDQGPHNRRVCIKPLSAGLAELVETHLILNTN